MILQTILIPKKYSLTEAKKWISENKYKLSYHNKHPELIANYWHFRQSSKTKGVAYRAKKIGDKIFIFKTTDKPFFGK